MKKLLICCFSILGVTYSYAQKGDNSYENAYRYAYYSVTKEYPKNIPISSACWQSKDNESKCSYEGLRDGKNVAQKYMLSKINKEEGKKKNGDNKKEKAK